MKAITVIDVHALATASTATAVCAAASARGHNHMATRKTSVSWPLLVYTVTPPIDCLERLVSEMTYYVY